MRRVLACGLILAAVPACAGDDKGPKRTILGTFTIRDVKGYVPIRGTKCEGSNGYEDIHAGTRINVSDGNAKVIAVGSLSGNGTVGPDKRCSWSWTVRKVPDESVYGFEIAGRGRATYTRDQLKEHPLVILTIG